MALQDPEHSPAAPKTPEEHLRPPLDVPVFWNKPGIHPPTPLEEWKEEFRIAMLAKYTIRIGKILNPPPPPTMENPVLETAPTGETRQAELERQRQQPKPNTTLITKPGKTKKT